MSSSPTFLIITRHDQRTSRRANIHFIADSLSKRGKTRIFSFAFSWLSRIKKDQRVELWNQSNRVIKHNDVECYLWRTIIHPVNLRKAFLEPLERFLFFLYHLMTPSILVQWASSSDYIIFESGFPILLVKLCKKVNPRAKLIYLASDSLTTIDCAKTTIDEFHRVAPLFTHLVLPSRLLKPEMPENVPAFFVPHGLDKSIEQHTDPNPYEGGVNIVSVGSMLFDYTFFELAADAFPDIIFHVIGGGVHTGHLHSPSIKIYGEMPFLETIPYIKHANAGVAPYSGDKVSPFLVDTSMKLMQYGFLGLPAICPTTVVGSYPGRFGYIPGDKQSIIAAIKAALKSGRFQSLPTLSWDEVTDRILSPAGFSDTAI